ncbi:MAG: sensor domain-containing diguanylate cyclase [Actinobacteria bacterium]|nr:sensor domain-containing diguanylate cyclase [Actinomycetota bacterium]
MTGRAARAAAPLHLYIAGLYAGALGLLVWVGTLSPVAQAPVQISWPLLALAFAAAEASVVHIEVGDDAHSFTLNELPLVVGLFLLGPWALVAARVTGGALTMAWTNRRSPVKLLFNVGLFAVEAAAAVVLFNVVRRVMPLSAPYVGWVAALAAVVVASVVDNVGVWMVIRIVGGGAELSPRLLELAALSSAGTATVGLITEAIVVSDARGLVLVLALGGVLFLGYRKYASLLRRFASLRQLHDFTRALAAAPELSTMVNRSLEQARSVLNAARAELCLIDDEADERGGIRLVLDRAGVLRTEHVPGLRDDPLLVRMAERPEPLLLRRGSRVAADRDALAAREARELIACPLVSGGQLVGTLAVLDRLGEVTSFDQDDLPVFETLANHVTVSLEKGRLIDRLRVEAAEKEFQSLHDALTGLGNRALYEQVAAGALVEARRTGRSLAVIVMDVNRFKDVNDTLGHAAGDVLLQQLGERLAAGLPASGTAVRLGATSSRSWFRTSLTRARAAASPTR